MVFIQGSFDCPLKIAQDFGLGQNHIPIFGEERINGEKFRCPDSTHFLVGGGQLSGDGFALAGYQREPHPSIFLGKESGYSECWIVLR